VLRRSSAVFFCDVKRDGVEAPEGGFDAMVMAIVLGVDALAKCFTGPGTRRGEIGATAVQ